MSAALTRPGIVPAADSQPYRLSVVTDPEQLPALRQEWTDLLLDSSRPNVFLSWEWMTAWLGHSSGRGRPHVLLVRTPNGVLAGLAPLYDTGPSGPLALRSLGLMGTGFGADHLAFVFRRGMEHQARDVLKDQLFSMEWDVLDFPRLEEDTARWLLDAAAEVGQRRLACASGLADMCPFVPLPETWEEYLGTLSANARKDLGRRWRRLQERGDVVIQRVQAVDELERAWEILLQLHRERRQAIDGRSAFTTGRVGAFHQEFMRKAAERGWLRLYLMRVMDQDVAVEYALSFAGRVSDLQCGFDPRWSRYGVGTLLVAHAIKDAISEGATEYDLMRGGEQYKQQRWAASLRRDVSLLVWRRQPRVAALVAARQWASALKSRFRQRLFDSGRPQA